MIRSDAIIRDLTRVNQPLQKHSAESLQRVPQEIDKVICPHVYSYTYIYILYWIHGGRARKTRTKISGISFESDSRKFRVFDTMSIRISCFATSFVELVRTTNAKIRNQNVPDTFFREHSQFIIRRFSRASSHKNSESKFRESPPNIGFKRNSQLLVNLLSDTFSPF